MMISPLRRSISYFLLVCGVGLPATISQASVKDFNATSMEEITSTRANSPFLMVLWSIDCPPCIKELTLFKENKDKLSKENFVLISTDPPEAATEITQLLKAHELENVDNWIFSDSLPDRLRYVIDPYWYGELPRAYFYNERHQRRPHSGILKKDLLSQWFEIIQSDTL